MYVTRGLDAAGCRRYTKQYQTQIKNIIGQPSTFNFALRLCVAIKLPNIQGFVILVPPG
jgi:hypothetical protein